MHREILERCFPLLIALVVSFGLLHLVIRLSGARWDFSRLKRLHKCEDGGVQAFSFVATLPMFVVIVAFIVQVSQLMIGLIGVHYSAYAGVRAASVWLPAEIPNIEPVNKVLNPGSYSPFLHTEHQPSSDQLTVVMGPSAQQESGKYRRIWTAAIMGIAPFCPSHDKGYQMGTYSPSINRTHAAASTIYSALMPNADAGKVDTRMGRKLAWAENNTMVFVEWRDLHENDGRHTRRGPTYNPLDHSSPDLFPYEQNEVGWQDPVTVHVYHRFALMPGPGKILAQLIDWDFNNDNSEQRSVCTNASNRVPCRHNATSVADPNLYQHVINQEPDASGTSGVLIHASATMNNDGLIPLYREEQYDF